MTDWAAHFNALASAMETALAENHETTFGEPVVGPTDFDRLDWPAAHVLPERSDYVGAGEYEHTGNVLFYFDRVDERRGSEGYLDHVSTAANAVSDIQTELGKDGRISEFKPTGVEHFAGAVEGTMLAVVQVSWTATTLVDFAA